MLDIQNNCESMLTKAGFVHAGLSELSVAWALSCDVA